MAHDAELDRLKLARDLAFQRKQTAYQVQDQAWKRRSAAREALTQVRNDMQPAYEAQNTAWQNYQQLRSRNRPRIDALNAQQETAYKNMKHAFDNASSAHDRHDGASARSYADQGHAYKVESQSYVAERRRLVQANRDAETRHELTRPAFQRAKDRFDTAKRTHDSAKTEHERRQADFKQAKATFDRADTVFRKRLETVKTESARKKDDKRTIAQRAGVPYRYLDGILVSRQSDGMINIYFGGVGRPNGSGHGHYVMDQYDRVVYKREPFEAHGAKNFQRDRQTIEAKMAQLAMDAWARRQTTKHQVQYRDGDYTIKAGSGYSRDRDAVTTDFIIAERTNSKEHYHLVIDEYGRVIYGEWRENH